MVKKIKELNINNELINSVEFSADGNKIITASPSGIIQIFDANNNVEEEFISTKLEEGVRLAIFSSDESKIITLSVYDEIRILNSNTLNQITTEYDNQFNLRIYEHNKLKKLVNKEKFAEIHKLEIPENNELEDISFSPKGNKIAVIFTCISLQNSSVYIYELFD
jgi:WD40 repeat protein